MSKMPTIRTERLKLRPFTLDDASEIQRLLSEWDVVYTTERIPHPYENGMAEEWIKAHQNDFNRGDEVTLAITHGGHGYLIGAITLRINKEYQKASLGYWIGKPYWNNGYCTESAQAILSYGFEVLGLNRIYATHMNRNPTSGRVMQKVGMKYEGHLRQHIQRWGIFEDIEYYGILRNEYDKSR